MPSRFSNDHKIVPNNLCYIEISNAHRIYKQKDNNIKIWVIIGISFAGFKRFLKEMFPCAEKKAGQFSFFRLVSSHGEYKKKIIFVPAKVTDDQKVYPILITHKTFIYQFWKKIC